MVVERVQVLAQGGVKELPHVFIRSAHERPENTKPVTDISVPTISLQSSSHDSLVRNVASASKEWGFFFVIDHGVPFELIESVKELGRKFVDLPQEVKEAYANDPSSGKLEGYGTKVTRSHDQKAGWADYFFHLMAPPSKVDYRTWPPIHNYREVVEQYNNEIQRVADELFSLLSEGLGLERMKLKSSLGGEDLEFEMKINMYPPCPQPQLALGVEAHTDMSALTILVPNDVPGLQVWKDEKWVSANYIPNALVIHIGDQIEVLSNGIYKSVLHRSVVNEELMRMSWVVFIAPPQETLIGPLQELVDDDNPKRYSTKTYGEYRYRKFNKLPQ